jgi:pSer/pThr/pTyr-binding forkhead associated (FHA) protein
VDIKVGAASGNPDATVQPGLQLRALMNPGRSAFRYFDEIAPLVKRAEDEPSAAISLGRSGENDIVLSVESVSHVHALFSSDGERWLLTDRDSKNGTTLNGTPLPKGQPLPLSNGDRILFGGEILAIFLTPEALYEKAVR